MSKRGESPNPVGAGTDPEEICPLDAVTDRLRQVVERAGGRVATARKSGVPVGTLNNYLAGRDLPRSALVAIADATGVSVEWLATGRGERHPDGTSVAPREREDIAASPPLSPGYVLLPRLDVQASAGGGRVNDLEQVVQYLAFDAEWLRSTLRRSPDQLLLIEARGDSMEPTIRDRDLLLVDVSDQELSNPAIHVLRVGEVLLVKRVERRLDGSLVVTSDNPRYQPEILTPAAAPSVSVVGRVLWQAGPVRT